MNKQYWNEIASSYEDQIFSVFKEDKNKKLLSYFEKYANKSHFAIDFGCGIGKAFDYLATRFKKVLAIDFAQNLLDTAKDNAPANIFIQKMDLTKFDLIWSKGHSMRMEQAIELAVETALEVTNE